VLDVVLNLPQSIRQILQEDLEYWARYQLLTRRCQITTAMRALPVVVGKPSVHLVSCLFKKQEPILVQVWGAKSPAWNWLYRIGVSSVHHRRTPDEREMWYDSRLRCSGFPPNDTAGAGFKAGPPIL
jgi:hypothetical protein